jgi:hypothetical protein
MRDRREVPDEAREVGRVTCNRGKDGGPLLRSNGNQRRGWMPKGNGAGSVDRRKQGPGRVVIWRKMQWSMVGRWDGQPNIFRI